MIDLQVEIAGADDVESALSGLADQVPFATALAINAVLNDAQDAIRAKLPSEFILRQKDFIERTIYIAPQDRARKDRLTGTVRVNPDRDFLAKFEEDTQKVPLRAHSLAVPVFRMDEPNRIIGRGDPLNLKALMDALERDGKIKRRRKKGMQGPLAKQTVFLIKSPKGTFLVERTYSQTRVLYAFKKSVPITPDLEFGETASATVEAMWDERASEALDRAIETMR